ncbi:hypothetical protein BDBG_02106 [Blastomyces gilchristii SLH14081]|uniref:Uncharacterized protein n=1 Tax=Blastomyces gilchristii (strain SLH14081) TaxID=559298 RepID=A0A179UDG7_BLAGS|nr:uncharacterized protein BDBG_02106 [Blastomyces gilchristii SLH14081]OAT05773.1 hypothetical protein BDBG_02106 [Blastomyces gilchristii SLH14081]
MAYDRDEFICLMTDYYNFCSCVFWEADTPLVQAPAGGWPSITQETFGQPLEERYFDRPTLQHALHIREGEIEGVAPSYTGQDPAIPPSCAAIAISRGRNGYDVILDTNDGYIYWGDLNGQYDEANEWCRYGFNVYELADFFALCKERYRKLSWIGTGFHDKLARKMKKAGWPGDGEGRCWNRAKFDMLLSAPTRVESALLISMPHAGRLLLTSLNTGTQSIDREWLSRFCRYLEHLTSCLPTMRHVSEPVFSQEDLCRIRDSDAELFAALHVEGNVDEQRKIGLHSPEDILHLIYGLLDYSDMESLQYARGVIPSPAFWFERGRMYRDF